MERSLGHGAFVTGTDTGVGKTLVGCLLLRCLRGRGFDVGAMKPVETGVGDAGPLDALALREAAGCNDDLALMCPQHFALPAAPEVAARVEGRAVDLVAIEAAWQTLRHRHRFLVVEGAGGLRVPVTPSLDMAELARSFDLPLLLVARGSLGTINHTLLSLDLVQRRGLPLLGVILNCPRGPLCESDLANLDFLKRELGSRLLGEIPYAPAPHAIDPIVARLI